MDIVTIWGVVSHTGMVVAQGMIVARTTDFRIKNLVINRRATRKGKCLITRHIVHNITYLFVELVVDVVVSLTSCDGESNVVVGVLGIVGRLDGAP